MGSGNARRETVAEGLSDHALVAGRRSGPSRLMMPDRKRCTECGKEFERPRTGHRSDTQWEKRTHCSQACARKSNGRRNQERWQNPDYAARMRREYPQMYADGKAGVHSGKRRSNIQGMQNSQWKGEDANYWTKHVWVARNKALPKACEECGATDRKLEWSNVDHKYARRLEDYRGLCRS